MLIYDAVCIRLVKNAEQPWPGHPIYSGFRQGFLVP
jgi:hypothetical protein